jgi:tetratricopeptide (TPR) repeat protein
MVMSNRGKRPDALMRVVILTALSMAICAYAQESKPTIRHHRVAETVPDDSTSPEVEQAEAAMQKNDFAAAEPLLQKAVAAKPDDYRAWFDLGYVYNATNRLPEAIEAYRKSVAAKPDVFESNLNLGLLLARQGNNAEAAKWLKAATQLKPTAHPDETLARAWQSLGRVEESLDPQQALAAYTESAKLAPKSPEPHLAAAVLLEKQNNLDAAAREYQTAAELDPKSQVAVSGLANVYIKQKKYPEAEAGLRRLLAADPQNSNARVQLGRLLADDGKNEEAAQELQKGLQADSSDGRTALELGTLYVKADKYSEAEQQFRIAVKSMPKDAEAHFALGSLLMHVRKYPEAQQELLVAVQLKPDLADAYGNLAVVAAENKDYQLTLKALDYRAKFLPESPATYFLRATTFDNLKAVPQAVEYYQRFLTADAGKLPDQEWQARHRLIALDPKHADKYQSKK